MLGSSGFLRLRRRKEVPLKDKIAAAVFLLESTTNKLRMLSDTLSRKDEKYFQFCIDAIVYEDTVRSKMYANECAEIRKLARLIISSQMALEQASLRLNTISTISDVLSNVTPIMGIVQETGNRLKGIVPSVTGKLKEVDHVLRSSLNNMGTATGDSKQADAEVQKILEDANVAAEETVRNKFPDFPVDLTEELVEKSVPVAIAEGGFSEVDLVEYQIKEQVYQYLKRCQGELSISDCATDLRVSPRDIEKTILQLKDEGKVFLS